DEIQIGNDGPSRQRRQRRVGRVITQRCPTGNAVDLLQGVLLSTLRTESHYDGRERRGGLLRHRTHTSLALAISNVSPLAQRNFEERLPNDDFIAVFQHHRRTRVKTATAIDKSTVQAADVFDR